MSTALERLRHEMEHAALGVAYVTPPDLALVLAVIEAAQKYINSGGESNKDLTAFIKSLEALTKDAT